ncbi:MAG: OsmC family protein [Bacteroidota bacterium]
MKSSVETSWKGNMMFDATVSGHHVIMDAHPAAGGEDKGSRPKELMLASIAGCSGMDVVSILKKMRVEFASLDIRVSADVTEEHPKHYENMHLVFEFSGKDLDMAQLNKAVQLSQERYCGVAYVYKKAMVVTWEVLVKPEA